MGDGRLQAAAIEWAAIRPIFQQFVLTGSLQHAIATVYGAELSTVRLLFIL